MTIIASILKSWILVLLVSTIPSLQQSILGERALPPLSEENLLHLSSSPDPLKNLNPNNPNSHISHILIPRPPDTTNNTKVRNYIISVLKALNWYIEEDEFEGDTPIGRKKFVNVIATKDPHAARKVSLAAHYDSKYFPPGHRYEKFLGATDSAAPCAILLDLAETLNPFFDERQHRLDSGIEDDEDVLETTLQLIFFDGEEAFGAWTDTDSIYGARQYQSNLAHKWATRYVQPLTKRRLMNAQATELSTIEHLILLDLLGASNPLIRSYFLETAWLFDALLSAEQRLGEIGAFAYDSEQSMAPGRWKSFFRPRSPDDLNYENIGDDHLPFLQRGVSVLHLIAEPFPHVWHTIQDDASALDLPTLRRWNVLMRVFVSEYLHLRPKNNTEHKEHIRWDDELVRAPPFFSNTAYESF
ncbi:glutaminyl-peptide cyclotransferase-like protein [Amanita rubescens]|nr:glutaminyl-peptide cyclotransferase-like protein [Amanita rubescens]